MLSFFFVVGGLARLRRRHASKLCHACYETISTAPVDRSLNGISPLLSRTPVPIPLTANPLALPQVLHHGSGAARAAALSAALAASKSHGLQATLAAAAALGPPRHPGESFLFSFRPRFLAVHPRKPGNAATKAALPK